ncbi:WD40 repeat domain-containing protein [Nonomuraea turkmeniaca]|uniref:WD40 repeat domain-containing protein n=1 Tax=Nonomuraea turkmeniaca TaxID=103838 RepID=A0A5S4G462_9ACTN|nr:WD40 repeat domain-containing protein [Nonomuraea turkmeniaca]TMR20750.1 WD40 repeat domain-containing protein [Nonomuraea turkmeniaca]
MPDLPKDKVPRRWAGLRWLVILPVLLGVLTAAAELSGIDAPGPATVALWGAVMVTAVSMGLFELVKGARERRLELTGRSAEDSRRLAELRTHFQPRGQGVLPSWPRRGWYFTGRERVLRELTGWLAAAPGADHRARLVVGDPGSGKSAVLGRIVTLSDPALRPAVPLQVLAEAPPGTLPPVGCVRAAVNAQGKTPAQVATEIAAALELSAGTPAELAAALAERELEPAGIVVDAVDEALEPAKLVYELLEPLAAGAARTGVRLLVGTRPGTDRHLVRRFGNAAIELDLNNPDYSELGDLVTYVRRCLMAEDDPDVPSPYRDRPDLAATVAAAVASRAGQSFLVAQLTSLSLAGAERAVDVESPGWSDRFPATVSSAMDQYLDRFGAHRRRARDLLMPLAWAEGPGLADRTAWARMATALGTASYTEADVSWLLRDTLATDLLRRTALAGSAHHRLFHAALDEHLRSLIEDERDPRDIHASMAGTLVELAPSDWQEADHYTRHYLVTHAARGAVLDPLLRDPGFLVASDPGRLLQALDAARSPQNRAVLLALQRVSAQLLVRPAAERASYLEMAARKSGLAELADGIRALPADRPWSVAWAHWRRIADGRVLARHDGYVQGLAITRLRGRQVIVSAAARAVHAHDVQSGELVADLPGDWPSPIIRLAALPDGGRVATVHEDGSVLHWDLGTQARSGPGFATDPGGDDDSLKIFSLGGDARVMASMGADGTIRVRDLATGDLIAEPFRVKQAHSLLGGGLAGGRALVVVLMSDLAYVQVWDLRSHQPVGPAFAPYGTDVEEGREATGHALIIETDGRPVVFLSGRNWHPCLLWDPERNVPLGEPFEGHEIGSWTVDVIPWKRGRLFCTGGGDGTIRCFEWPAGGLAGQPLHAHDGAVDHVLFAELDGRPAIVSGGRDGLVRWWPLAADLFVAGQTGPYVHDLTVAEVAGLRLVIGREPDLAVLRSWDLATGEHVMDWPLGEADRVVHLAPLPRLAVGLRKGGLRVLDLETGSPLGSPQVSDTGEWTDLGLMEIRGRSTLAIAWSDGTLHLWDVVDERWWRPPLRCHTGPFFFTYGSVGGVAHAVTWADGEAAPLLWNVEDASRATELEACRHDRHDPVNSGYCLGSIGDRPVIVLTGGFSHVDVWNGETGRLDVSGTLHDGHAMALGRVRVARLVGRDCVLSGGYAGALAIWTPDGSIARIIEVGGPIWWIVPAGESRIVVSGLMGMMAIDLADDYFDRPELRVDLRL